MQKVNRISIGGTMFLRQLLLCAFMISLAGCSYFEAGEDIKYVKDPYNPNRMVTAEQAQKKGKVGFGFGLGSSKDEKPQGYKEKNYFLWSACVDVLSDLPAKISDSAGGIYTTDYVLNQDGHKQSVQCRILGEKVLSKNVEITVFTLTNAGELLSSSENNALKSNVLIRARELKAQYDQQV